MDAEKNIDDLFIPDMDLLPRSGEHSLNKDFNPFQDTFV